MLFRQFLNPDLGCASYLIGDEEAGVAVLVDPVYEIDPFLAEAELSGVRLTHVLETHTHADHLSGHGRLALDHGVAVAIHEDAGAEYPHEPLRDGSEIAVGSLSVRTIHTPGHRPEHCCFLIDGRLLTGDSLFVGSVARPDLAVEAREGAEGLFHSLHRLLELPDSVQVFPGHVAGSLCGAGMSADPSSTVGQERRVNSALAIATVEQFVVSQSVLPPRPPNMERIVELNRGPFVGAPPPLRPVSSAGGATVLDVRPAETFAQGHVPGAINVPVSGSAFGTKTGFLLGPDERVVLHAPSREEAERAARGLHAIGFLDLDGYLEDASATATTEPMEIDELERVLGSDDVELVDVREGDEWQDGYIPGSRHVPYRLLRGCADTFPRDKTIVTICESGPRAAVAASVLEAAGYHARPVLHGGIDEWERRGHATVKFRRCG